MEFSGIIPYLVSPIDSSGKVMEIPLRRLVEALIGQGVHGLSPLGSTGEVAYLSFKQRLEIVRIVVDQAAGRVPVIPGVAAYSTAQAVVQAQAFTSAGVGGLVVILQVMNPLQRSGIIEFYRTVSQSTPLPLILYTNPGLYGLDLSFDVVEELSSLPTIRYIKDASGNTGRIQSLINRFGDRLKIFSASAHLPAVVFQLGGVGWMAGPACVIPRQCLSLYNLCQNHQWAEAYALQARLWWVNEMFQKYGLAPFIKAALNLQGFAVGNPIPPQEALPPGVINAQMFNV